MKFFKKSAAARAASAIAAAVMTTLMVVSQAGLAWHYAPETETQEAHYQTPSEFHTQQYVVPGDHGV